MFFRGYLAILLVQVFTSLPSQIEFLLIEKQWKIMLQFILLNSFKRVTHSLHSPFFHSFIPSAKPATLDALHTHWRIYNMKNAKIFY